MHIESEYCAFKSQYKQLGGQWPLRDHKQGNYNSQSYTCINSQVYNEYSPAVGWEVTLHQSQCLNGNLPSTSVKYSMGVTDTV